MDEHMAVTLDRLCTVLHWLGKFDEMQAVSALAALCRRHDLRTYEDVRAWAIKRGAWSAAREEAGDA